MRCDARESASGELKRTGGGVGKRLAQPCAQGSRHERFEGCCEAATQGDRQRMRRVERGRHFFDLAAGLIEQPGGEGMG
jgi:hypothetical protein